METLARLLGLKLVTVAFVAGLFVAGGPAGYGGYKLGGWSGYAKGQAAANAQAQINDLQRKVAEKAEDARIAQEAATRAEDSRSGLEAAKTAAEGALNEYRAEVEAMFRVAAEPSPDAVGESPLARACPDGRRATRFDVDRLRIDAGRVHDGAGNKTPPGGE